MKSRRQIVKAGLILAGLVTAVVVGVAAARVWNTIAEVEHLEATLRQVAREAVYARQAQQQYDGIAVELSREVEELNRLLMSFVAEDSPRIRQSIQQRSRRLSAWTQDQKSTVIRAKTLTTSITFNVVGLMRKIEKSFLNYSQKEEQLLAVDRNAGNESLLRRWAEANSASQELLALAGEAQANAKAIELFLTGSSKWSPQLRGLVTEWLPLLTRVLLLAASLTVLTLGGILALSFYRLMVAPLRTKVLQSDAIIERQKKLAHLGELASGLAHEIRNPLTAINARLFTLQRVLPEETEEANDARIIREEVRRLDRIVRDFLDLARPRDPQRAPMSVSDLLREVREFLSPSLHKQGLKLKWETNADAQVSADRQQLKQVLINLIQNAADSMGDSGTVTLRTSRDRRELEGQATDALVIEVEDTGPGIPEQIHDKLFDPFFSTKDGGTGLGLPIAKKILVQHGGDLEFVPDSPAGATFRIILPLGQTAAHRHAENPHR